MGGDEPEIDEGYAEALERLRVLMRRHADEEITLAIRALLKQEYGYTSTEIQEQLGLGRREMRAMALRLQRAAKAMLAEA